MGHITAYQAGTAATKVMLATAPIPTTTCSSTAAYPPAYTTKKPKTTILITRNLHLQRFIMKPNLASILITLNVASQD